MASGRKALHDIDRAIADARKRVGSVSSALEQSSARLADLRRRQSAAMQNIARERLELIKNDPQADDLGRADARAATLLEKHASAVAAAKGTENAADARIADLEKQRRAQEKTVEAAIKAYDIRTAETEKSLLSNVHYLEQKKELEQAGAIVDKARQKFDLAQSDADAKSEAYKADPLFAYLQRRRFGTDEAKGWFLTKALDGWVAGIIKYKEAERDYRRLNAIPERLAEHVTAVEDDVSAETKILEEIEQEALEAAGVMTLRDASLTAQQKLEALDAAITQAEADHQAAVTHLNAVLAGESGPYVEAMDVLYSALSHVALPDLRALAAQTRSRRDDDAIVDLVNIDMAADRLSDEMRETEGLLPKAQRWLAEMERVRQRFKSARYDSPSSDFPSWINIAAIMGEVVSGALDGDDLWDLIRRSQRTVSRRTSRGFGGDIFTEGYRLPKQKRRKSSRSSWPSGGRSTRRSTPRMPKIRVPRSSGRRGGGFKTGGGF